MSVPEARLKYAPLACHLSYKSLILLVSINWPGVYHRVSENVSHLFIDD